jgi:Uma2 family endonuclease
MSRPEETRPASVTEGSKQAGEVDCSGSTQSEMEAPAVIFEVPSPQTARADHGDKLLNYQGILSLRAYVLVDQFQPPLTVYRPGANGEWIREILTGLRDALRLPEIGCTLPLESIYERVFTPPTVP